MTYLPKVNDYVQWKERNLQGWIYFECSSYVTIEISIKPKTSSDYEHSSIHANHRVLVLCFQNEFKQLSYVKSRKSVYEN